MTRKPWSAGPQRSKLLVQNAWGIGVSRLSKVVHKVDPERCSVVWDVQIPEWTLYDLRWLCVGKPVVGDVKLFRNQPRDMKLCATCSDSKRLYISLMKRGRNPKLAFK